MIINRIERRSIPPRALTESMTSIAQGVVVQAASTSEYTVDDTQTPTGDAGTLSALLNWIGHMVKAITGKANWRTAPARTLEQCVDTAGLTTNTVPVATGANTLGNSRIVQGGANGQVDISYVGGDTLPTLSVGGSSSNRAGVYAITSSGTGVYGQSSTGSGVYGNSDYLYGVYGESYTYTGVKGTSDSGYGVEAASATGTALFATANSTTAAAAVVQQLNNYDSLYIVNSGVGANAVGLRVLLSGVASSGDMATMTHSGAGYTGNGYRVTLTSSGHGVKVLQEGAGKGAEITIYNAASSAIAADAYTNGSGIAIKGKTEGAGRAAFFEVNRSSATDPAVEIKITNTSDAGVGLRVNGLGTGSMLQVQDNGANVLEVKDGSKIGFYGVAAVARAGALTAKDTSTVDATYGTQERDVINNNRTRISEIETALKNIGILT